MNEKRGRKEGNVIVVGVSCGKEIGAVGKGVRSSKLGTWDVSELKVEISEIQEPTSLATIQVLGGAEEGEVFVICENPDREWGAMKVVTPGFESTNNGEEFPIVNIIVTFCRGE